MQISPINENNLHKHVKQKRAAPSRHCPFDLFISMNPLYVLSTLSFSLLVSALSAEASLPVVFLSQGSPRHRGRAQSKSDRHCPVPTSPLQHTLQKGKSSSCSSLQSITINTLKSIIKSSLQSFLPISTNTFR